MANSHAELERIVDAARYAELTDSEFVAVLLANPDTILGALLENARNEMHNSDERRVLLRKTLDAFTDDEWVNPKTGHGGDCGCVSCHMSQGN